MGRDDNNLKLAVLGLVAARPEGAYGYLLMNDLSAAVSATPRVSVGAVYRLLAELESEKLVELELVVQNGKPNRKLFRTTEKGRDALGAWIRRPLPTDPKPLDDEFSVRLLLQPVLDLDVVCGLINQQRSLCVGRLGRLDKQRKRLHATQLDPDATELFFMGIETQLRARMSWLESVERFLVRNPRTKRSQHGSAELLHDEAHGDP